MNTILNLESYQKQCELAREKAKQRVRERNKICKNGELPYSFNYKIQRAFIGRECPICKRKMGVYIKSEDNDPIISSTPMPSIQHNMPLSKGGKHELSNISVICRSCNSRIKDSVTGSLNNSEVVEIWQKMTKKDTTG